MAGASYADDERGDVPCILLRKKYNKRRVSDDSPVREVTRRTLVHTNEGLVSEDRSESGLAET
jgi:hypothetical protein